jgi:hypothetical protein
MKKKHINVQFSLLTVEPKKSPRLLWLEKHDVKIEHYPKVTPGEEDEFGDEIFPWIARTGLGYWAGGKTEQEAIRNLAIKRNWKLWNEEV